MRGTIRRAVGATTTVALATVLAGCALGGPTHTGATELSAGPEQTAVTAPSPSTSPSTAPSAPAGTVYISADRAGLRFAVPEDWKVLDLADVLASGDPKALQELADRMNLPVSQIEAAARTTDVAAFGAPVQDFAPNVNVQTVPLAEVPSETQLRLGMEMVGATVDSVEDVETALGTARVSSYSLPVNGTTVTGHQLGVKAPDGVAMITISDLSADRADVLLAMIEASLRTT